MERTYNLAPQSGLQHIFVTMKQNEVFCTRAKAIGKTLADAQADRYDDAAKDELRRSLIAMRYVEAATLRTRECFIAEAIRNDLPDFDHLLVAIEQRLVKQGISSNYARVCLRGELGEYFRKLALQGYRLRMLERKRTFHRCDT